MSHTDQLANYCVLVGLDVRDASLTDNSGGARTYSLPIHTAPDGTEAAGVEIPAPRQLTRPRRGAPDEVVGGVGVVRPIPALSIDARADAVIAGYSGSLSVLDALLGDTATRRKLAVKAALTAGVDLGV